MLDFSLTLVLQFKTSKIIYGMANISKKCEHSKNKNQILISLCRWTFIATNTLS